MRQRGKPHSKANCFNAALPGEHRQLACGRGQLAHDISFRQAAEKCRLAACAPRNFDQERHLEKAAP